MEEENIEKIKTYLKEYQDILYSMHDTAIEGIKLHKNKDFEKEPQAQDILESAMKLKNESELKIEDINMLLNLL